MRALLLFSSSGSFSLASIFKSLPPDTFYIYGFRFALYKYIVAYVHNTYFIDILYVYIYNAPALPACNWSKARLVPPLGWTNGYAQAKANPCASSSTTITTPSSSSNNVFLLFLLYIAWRSSPQTPARRKMQNRLLIAMGILRNHTSIIRHSFAH